MQTYAGCVTQSPVHWQRCERREFIASSLFHRGAVGDYREVPGTTADSRAGIPVRLCARAQERTHVKEEAMHGRVCVCWSACASVAAKADAVEERCSVRRK